QRPEPRMAPNNQSPEQPGTPNPGLLMTVTRIVTLLAILLVGGYVALSPAVFYAPTPRIVLYLLVAILPAILFGSEIAASFRWEMKGLVITATDVFASILILLL